MVFVFASEQMADSLFQADEEKTDGVDIGLTRDHEFSALHNFGGVRMVACDNLQTARAIALECGILGSNADAEEPNLIEGKSFRAMTDAQRLEVCEKISVMGRSSPNDKLLLVQALRKKGHVVAISGDETNYAPALHEADIGHAMGIQGTEAAKESSDIIILDDEYASVVKVVRWGRSVYANIQKFIQFQLTVNVAALVINVVAAVSLGDVPLNAMQLLWVNLIMDTLGALALATEPPTDHLRESRIANIMWRNLLIQVVRWGRSVFAKIQKFIQFQLTVIVAALVIIGRREPLLTNSMWTNLLIQVVIVKFVRKITTNVRLSWQLWFLVSLNCNRLYQLAFWETDTCLQEAGQ